MQSVDHNELAGPINEYEPKRLEAMLKDPNVKYVRVFNLKKGDRVQIGGHTYKVTAVRPNGKVTMRPE